MFRAASYPENTAFDMACLGHCCSDTFMCSMSPFIRQVYYIFSLPNIVCHHVGMSVGIDSTPTHPGSGMHIPAVCRLLHEDRKPASAGVSQHKHSVFTFISHVMYCAVGMEIWKYSRHPHRGRKRYGDNPSVLTNMGFMFVLAVL